MGSLERLAAGVDTGVFEQRLYHVLHPVGPVDGEVDELHRVLVQHVAVAPFEQREVTRDGPEWLLEIV